MDLCKEIIRHEGDDVPLDVLSHSCWLAGRIGLQLGEIESAEGLAKLAVSYGTAASNENRCLYDSAELLRDIRQVLLGGKPEGS